MYDIQGKKAFPISSSGSLTLDTKGKWIFDKDFIEVGFSVRRVLHLLCSASYEITRLIGYLLIEV